MPASAVRTNEPPYAVGCRVVIIRTAAPVRGRPALGDVSQAERGESRSLDEVVLHRKYSGSGRRLMNHGCSVPSW